MTAPGGTARDRIVAFRRRLGRIPRLTRRTVRARGLDFAVFASPEVPGATPLVCVNGGLLFDHSLLWPALSPLAARRQLILYDQRGRGESEPPADPAAARIEDDAADLGAIRTALGIGAWDVLGHSWGGGIAMLGTERDQDGVRRLVLVDAVGVNGMWRSDLVERAAERLSTPEFATQRAALVRIDLATLARPDVKSHSAWARALHPAWFADPDLARFVPLPRSTSETGASISARLWRDGYDWSALMGALRRPTLVLHGDVDLLPVEVARSTATLLPNARLRTLPGAGHLPFLETADAFFEAVEEFLGTAGTS